MNIAVISPDNRGTGVTSIAMLLAMSMKNRSLNSVVTSIADGRNGLREYIGELTEEAESASGMKEIHRLITAGSISGEDAISYCINRGIDILPRAEGMSAKSVAETIAFVSGAVVNGKKMHTIVDVDIADMMDKDSVGAEVKAADVIVLVLTQNIMHLKQFKENRANMAKAFAKKKVFVVVNKYDKFAGTLKDIWGKAGMKYGDGWYEVRYNKCVALMTAKCFVEQVTTAMGDASDSDIMALKSDIDRIALAILKSGK